MRIYRARKDLFFREISATIMVGSMKRKKVRKPRWSIVIDGHTFVYTRNREILMHVSYTALGLELSGVRRLCKWLDSVKAHMEQEKYLESREGK